MIYQELTHNVVGLCMEIHSALGPGLLESAYQECLFYKLEQNGLYVQKQKPMPVIYEEVRLD